MSEQPILQAKGSGSATELGDGAATLSVFDDRVELHQRRGLRQIHQSIRYEQVAQVALEKTRWGYTILVESTGGAALAAPGLRGAAAGQARKLIEERVRNVREPQRGAPASIADELKKLLELRELGALNADEFEEQKRRLLDS